MDSTFRSITKLLITDVDKGMESAIAVLPADEVSALLTEVLPSVFLFIQLLIILTGGERKLGRCFIPNTDNQVVSPSQVLYVTEVCLDHAHHYTCLDPENHLKDECLNNKCNYTNATNDDKRSLKLFHQTLFMYRYHFWILLCGSLIRASPRFLWKRFAERDLKRLILILKYISKYQHDMLGREISSGSSEEKVLETSENKVIAVIKEESKKRSTFWLYILRKSFEFSIDATAFGLITTFLKRNSPFNTSVFLCDILEDRYNIFLCDSLKVRFLPCEISYSGEFLITGLVIFVAVIIDLILQFCIVVKVLWPSCTSESKHEKNGYTNIDGNNVSKACFWSKSLSEELKLDKLSTWTECRNNNFRWPTNLYLAGLMYVRNNVHQDHYLEYMLKQPDKAETLELACQAQDTTLTTTQTKSSAMEKKHVIVERNDLSEPETRC